MQKDQFLALTSVFLGCQFDAVSFAMHRVVTVGSMRTGVIELNARIDWPAIWVMLLDKAWCL